MDAEVIVVGAGPTGLALANVLIRQGVEVAVFDSKSGPSQESRAMGVHARTLEFYQQLGLAEEVVSRGIPAREVEVFIDGKQKVEFSMSALGEGISAFPYMLTFPQDEHERILLKAFEEYGGKVHWNSPLLSFSQTTGDVTATFAGANSERTLSGRYLVGCDGANSMVRRQLDIGFGGGTSDGLFFVADAQIDVDHDNRIRAALSDSTFGLMMPVRTTGTQRLIGAVPAPMQTKEHFEFDDVEPLLTRLLQKEIKSVSWFSTYRVHHRVADKFREGRVFIAGDAGHIHSPVGGQGMNTGIGDAINIGWKLASVLKLGFSEALLETYDPERRAFAKLLISTTDGAFQRITAPNSRLMSFFKWLLPFAIWRLTTNRFTKKRLFRTVSQVHIGYEDSALSSGKLGKHRAGQRLAWDPSGANYRSLEDMRWHVQVYGSALLEVQEWADKRGFPIHEIELNDSMRALGFRQGSHYLIRPDGHIAVLASAENALAALQDFDLQFQK
jgi:2-polyprenyl-6-methoxyphenol hydroxylase-like FAD-dependent oxidoreductase